MGGLQAIAWLVLGALSSAAGLEQGRAQAREVARRRGELEVQLADKDAALRRRAVVELADMGGREAWELVIGALGDPKGEVADEAQFVLAGLDEERALGKLFGEAGLGSKDALVRSRAAEVLGRMQRELDGDGLLRETARRDPSMSEMLLWSVERLAAGGRLGGDRAKCARGLVKLVKGGGDVRVRAQALCALAAVDDESLLPLLSRLLGEKEHELRCAALEAGTRIDPAGALERGARLAADEHPSVRLAALEALASAGVKRSLELLVERLEVEPRFRLQAACVEHLQTLSARKHKLDPRPWRLWISGLPEDWTVADRAAPTGEVGGTASLAGLPILSDRIAFLIDFSGSLWYEREGRPPRKTRVDELMRAALPHLQDGTEFNVIPYTAVPHPWREALVPATEKNVRAALADFEACTEKGSGNVFDAVLLALADRGTDRIVILTDGAPTGGARWKLDLMMPLLQQAARFDRVTYDAIVVDAKPGLRKRWFALAAATGGRAISIDL
jgi:HEAT repeat protein